VVVDDDGVVLHRFGDQRFPGVTQEPNITAAFRTWNPVQMGYLARVMKEIASIVEGFIVGFEANNTMTGTLARRVYHRQPRYDLVITIDEIQENLKLNLP
jgi:hypothetical protein